MLEELLINAQCAGINANGKRLEDIERVCRSDARQMRLFYDSFEYS